MLVAWFVFTPSADWVELNYSQRFYPWLASWLVPLMDLSPLSVAAVMLVALPLLWLLVLFVSFSRRLFWRWLALSLWRMLTSLLVVAVLFVLIWGANYQRQPIEQQLGLQVNPMTQQELLALTDALEHIIQREQLAVRDEARALASIRQAMVELVAEVNGVTPVLPERIKRPPAGLLLRLGNALGVISPWTLEAHVERALPDAVFVAVAAHELAHVAGYAGEADADLIGALAGLRADDGYARYAVALNLWQTAVWQLPASLREARVASLPAVAQQDLAAYREALNRHRPPALFQTLQQQAYDSYLRSQGVSSGIQDYGRTLGLLQAVTEQGLWLRLE